MTLDPGVARVLVRIADIMAPARDQWCFMGGVAALLHGVPIGTLDDVDVLLTAADASRLLPGRGIEPTPDGGTDRFRSQIFSRTRIDAIQVDFLAGFEVRSEGVWLPIRVASVQPVRVDGIALPVASVEDLIAMHALFDRPKDAERMRALRALLATS